MWQEFCNNGKLTTLEFEKYQIKILGPIPLPKLVDTRQVIFNWYPFIRVLNEDDSSMLFDTIEQTEIEWSRHNIMSHLAINSLLTYGEIHSCKSPLVRVHSSCVTGDVFGSMRCDCNSQLEASFSKITDSGVGAVVYMAGHEGRGIGLWAKGAAYLLQDAGLDTYCANRTLNLPEDCRDFTDAALVLKHYLAPKSKIRLMTNNPLKCEALQNFGLEILERVPLLASVNIHNSKYMSTKARNGHILSDLSNQAIQDYEKEKTVKIQDKSSFLTTQDIFDIADRYCDSALLQFSHSQDIFELLQKPRTSTEVAELKGWILRKTNILLNALAAIGLLLKEGDLYQNSQAANKALVTDSPEYIGDLIEHERLQWQLWSQLDDVLKSKNAISKQQDLNLPSNVEANTVFHRAMQQLSKVTIQHVLDLQELRNAKHILDLAGGHGIYLAELAKYNPNITGEVWDVSSARLFAEDVFARYEVDDRLRFCERDISLSSSYEESQADAVMLNHCLHHFDTETILEILKQVANILPTGGVVTVIEVFLRDNLVQPINGAMFSLYMMVNTVNGEVHPTNWIANALENLGFDVEVKHLSNLEDDVLIVGRKR